MRYFAVAGGMAVVAYKSLLRFREEKHLIKNLAVPSFPLNNLLEDLSECIIKGIKCCTYTLAHIFRVLASLQYSVMFCFTSLCAFLFLCYVVLLICKGLPDVFQSLLLIV